MFGILTKFIGVKDIVNMRVSLPAQLLDPISNLEFWSYMDCPAHFGLIADDDDPLERMLNVVRYWFSKDSRFMSPTLAKPFNSMIGEQFIAWHPVSGTDVIRSLPSTPTLLARYSPVNSNSDDEVSPEKFRVWSLIEQISHHPPVSAYYYYCPEKKILCRGVDHVCAKFTGTAAKIFSGPLNHGLYITLGTRDNEEYQLTHPNAYINGWLKLSLYVTVADTCIITCPKTGLATILEYKEESFFGRAKFAIEGKIIKWKVGEKLDGIKLSKISKDDVVCSLTGSWKGQIFYQKTSDPTSSLLLDMTQLKPHDKHTKPIDQQEEHESRRLWRGVADRIKAQDYSEATRLKRDMEDKQRKEEKERKAKHEPYISKWFGFLDPDAVGNQQGVELVLDDGDTSTLIKGKPFIRKDAVDRLPWNISSNSKS